MHIHDYIVNISWDFKYYLKSPNLFPAWSPLLTHKRDTYQKFTTTLFSLNIILAVLLQVLLETDTEMGLDIHEILMIKWLLR